MARDSSLYVRRAVVSRLKAEAAVSALVADRVYGLSPPSTPAWPFVKMQPPTSIPLRATGLDGARIAFRVSGFAKGPDESEAAVLADAIAGCLDGLSVPLYDAPYSARLTDVRWLSTQIIRDPEESTGWHAFASFEATITS